MNTILRPSYDPSPSQPSRSTYPLIPPPTYDYLSTLRIDQGGLSSTTSPPMNTYNTTTLVCSITTSNTSLINSLMHSLIPHLCRYELSGLIKAACRLRPEMRVVVTSATMDANKMADYFGPQLCGPVLNIPGRVFPVDIYHSKTKQIMTATGPSSAGYVEAAVETVLKIHCNPNQQEGHILVFLTGSDEIEKVGHSHALPITSKRRFTLAMLLVDRNAGLSYDSHSSCCWW